MDGQRQDRRQAVAGQDAVQQFLRRLQLISLLVHVRHGLTPCGAADGCRQLAPQRHDGTGDGLVLHRHQQMGLALAFLDVQLPYDIAAVLLVEALRAMQPCDRFTVPLPHRSGHHLVAALSEEEVHRVPGDLGMRDEELGSRIHIFHGRFLTNISYEWHQTNIFSSFSNTIA